MLSGPQVPRDGELNGALLTAAQGRQQFEREFEALIGGLPMAFFRLDEAGKLVSYGAGRFALALPPEQFLGRRIVDVFPAPLAQLLGDAVVHAQVTGESRAVEYEIAEASGQPRHYTGNVAPAHGGGVTVLIQDTTEQRRAQATLRASERRFRALIERATDVLYVVDAQMKVLFWSPGSSEALGWTAEDAVGRNGLEFIHPDDVGQIVPPQRGSPEEAGRFTYRVRHRDGSYRVLDAVVRNHLADPAIEGIIINARDVTEERRREASSAESSKLESIGRLAGGVAHDFNNLLTVILGCAGFVSEAVDAGVLPDRQDLSEIVEAAQRARDLTQQLLAFARKQVIEPAVIDVNELMTKNERMLRRVLGEDVVIELSCSSKPCHVRCDVTQLQQVVFNLAANARDAMPQGGHLQIAVAAVDLDAEACAALPGLVEGPHVRLTVRDDGTGLSPEIRAHIFEPFFTTKAVGKGTGLGLATVYGIVRQSGGAITVDSTSGAGTTFDIYLPSTDDHQDAAAESTRDRTKGHERILIVEDESVVGKVAARILRDGGYTVFVVQDGRDAIALAKREAPIHLLLTDVVMPGLNGPLVAQALRAENPTIRVLYVSGYPEEALVRPGATEPNLQFLEKPYSPNKLLARVREVLSDE